MGIEKILVVDDEPLMRDFFQQILSKKKYTVKTVEDGKRALSLLEKEPFDLIFTDMAMEGVSGLDLIEGAKKRCPSALIIVITGFATVENAVEAMQKGAYHYLMKPLSEGIILEVIQKAKEHASLEGQNSYFKQRILEESKGGSSIIAESPAMKKILKEVKLIAESEASVFISGESGSGKEVIAALIHEQSRRVKEPYIKMNCAAISESLIESEMFGHEKGAFTGAHQRKPGRFELADNGSLLLDEITEIPPSLQAKLLRITQEMEFERVGGVTPIRINVRLISTSNRVMKEAIREKLFREDLFYRLSVIPIHLPPLRMRKEDILPLARSFLLKASRDNHREPKHLKDEAEKKLLAYHFPGNVRELSNIIERAVILSKEKTIGASSLMLDPINENSTLSLKELEEKDIVTLLQGHEKDLEQTAAKIGITKKELLQKLTEKEND